LFLAGGGGILGVEVVVSGRMRFLGPLSRFIYSMADSRQDMAHDLRRYSGPLMVHLLLLIYFSGEASYDHWRGEAFGFFPHSLVRFKGSSKFPNQEFLDKYLFRWLIDEGALLKHFAYKVLKEALPFPVGFEDTVGGSLKRVEAVLHEATGILAESHIITQEQFYGVLDKHGF
jgi:hypothetical protein